MKPMSEKEESIFTNPFLRWIDDRFPLSSLIKDSSFVIANDTGPAHMTAHLGAKGVALFGSHTTPFKVSIERENFKAIQSPELSKLSAEKVFEKLSEIIS